MATQVTNYQCPSCMAPLHFVGESGRLECDYCESTYTVAEIEALYADANNKAAQEELSADAQAQYHDQWGEDAKNMRAYSCPSCGAELICDVTTAATSCPYCGNPTIVPGQFAGTRKPDYVIPFQLSKEDAVDALRKHCKGKPLLPKAFKSEHHIQELKGVYVPFWLFDGEADADVTFTATRTHSHRRGDDEIINTQHFRVRRAGTVRYKGVPVDGSSKMPDDYMDAIEPYDYEELKPFAMAYLPGFLADKFDVSADSSFARAKARMGNSALDSMAETVFGYETCIPVSQHTQVKNTNTCYVLMPVWMLSTRWKGKNYLFAMNGQTGKIVGELPVSWGRFWGWFFGLTAGIGAALLAILLGSM
ncbi:MAG: hypothetical protein J6J04_03195 [Oscillospiraceae bacterium]|nr:hypothetical protein [Oscillospiraceae bacterium]